MLGNHRDAWIMAQNVWNVGPRNLLPKMDEYNQTCLKEWPLYKERMKEWPGEGGWDNSDTSSARKPLPLVGLETQKEETQFP